MWTKQIPSPSHEKQREMPREVPPVSRPCPVPVPAGGWIMVLHSSSWLLHSPCQRLVWGWTCDILLVSGMQGILQEAFLETALLIHERSHFCTCLLHSHLRWCLREDMILEARADILTNHEESHGQNSRMGEQKDTEHGSSVTSKGDMHKVSLKHTISSAAGCAEPWTHIITIEKHENIIHPLYSSSILYQVMDKALFTITFSSAQLMLTGLRWGSHVLLRPSAIMFNL